MKTLIRVFLLSVTILTMLVSSSAFAQIKGSSGTITGSGTTNYIPKFTSGLTIGDSPIFSDATNNIGIGTTIPQTTLQIHSNSGPLFTLSNLTSTANALLGSVVGRGNGYSYNAAKIDMNIEDAWQGGNYSSRISFWTTGNGTTLTERMRINKSGNVGIGETTPTDKLYIKQTDANLPGLFIKNTNGSSGFQLQGSTGNQWKFIAGGSAFAMYDVTRSAYRFWINNSADGNVGIGTTTPGQKLEVNGNIKVPWTGRMILGNNATAYIQGYEDGQDLEGLKFFTTTGYSGGAMIITNSGRVGIGKSPNTIYHLDVNGKIRANEVVVNTTGADFVFNDEYRLRTLTEVESFIKENKHLPEIPNAEEMQQNGMSLSEMNTKLLQKVEELTLYVIEQSKQVEALKVSNSELKEILFKAK